MRRSVAAFAVAAFVDAQSAAADDAPEARLDRLEQRLHDPEAARARSWTDVLHLSGYLQPQLVVSIANAGGSPNADANGRLPGGISPNATIARADGTTSNGTFFRLRRARLRTEVTPSDFAQLTLEIEPLPKGTNIGSTGTFARTVEAIGFVRIADETRFELAAGQFNLPFGSEIMESNAGRPFIDSSFAMAAMFPGDFDIGARGTFVHHGLTVMTSVVNGVMIGEPTFAVFPDNNHTKDVTARIDYDFGPLDVGASTYLGAGTVTDPSRLALASYRRRAINGESTVHHTFSQTLGMTKVVLSATLGANMDRGIAYAFGLPDLPRRLGDVPRDKRQLAGMVRVEQDVTEWVTLGVRYDYYTPELDVADDGRNAFAAVFALHFTSRLQTMLEYDVAFDHAHMASAPAARRVTDTLSAVCQARF